MPEAARKYNSNTYNYYENTVYTNRQPRSLRPEYTNIQAVPHKTQPLKRAADNKKIQRNYLIHRIISVCFILLFGIFVMPKGFQKFTVPVFIGNPYKNIKTDFQNLRYPTENYLANDWFLGKNFLTGAELKKPKMENLKENQRLTGLENEIKQLMSQYPSIEPSVYVWSYDDGSYADINADTLYSAASIIKLPVLAELFRAIEKGEVSLSDKMSLTEYYRSEGSGSLQFKAANSNYTIDKLARMMITESDNSATNMLVAKLGSMTRINNALRSWGLTDTAIATWLPDLRGNNHTTARDMAKILYNIDNPDFLNINSREKIFDYMSHVHNNRLIQAGLPSSTVFLHKTGDIGKMLGDAGIVFAPYGKKYIVVILANRPHNSPQGRDFIVKASEVIYNFMVK